MDVISLIRIQAARPNVTKQISCGELSDFQIFLKRPFAMWRQKPACASFLDSLNNIVEAVALIIKHFVLKN